MLKIWGRANSTNVKKAVWCAGELDLPFERIEAGGAFGVVNDAPYRAMNPNGLVPCLEDDGFILWESNAIVRYLSAKYGVGTLWHEDPAVRAVGDKWMDWATTAIATPFRDLFRNKVRLAPDQRDVAAMEKGLETCTALFKRVDAELSRMPYLSGETFAMGDIPLGCFAYAWFEMDIARPDLPHLRAWYDRIRVRPAFIAGVAIPLT